MKPLDPRLLRYARATSWFVLLSVVFGTASAVLVIAQASVVAHVVVRATAEQASLASLQPWFVTLAVIAVARALATWAASVVAARCGASAKSQLRAAVLRCLADRGPVALQGQRPGSVAVVVSHGIDALDGFFTRYLSQLVLAAIVPIVVMTRIVVADWLSAFIIAVTIPLVPVFMVLVGKLTQGRMNEQYQSMSMLSAHFLDIVRGLPTLRSLGRADAQTQGIAEASEQLRKATMRNLRVAFLSSFVLELCSTMGIALVAVSAGFRLLDGEMDYESALLVLLLVPEVYIPLRNVGTQFHANADGVAAAEAAFAVLDGPSPRHDGDDVRRSGGVRASLVPIAFDNVSITYDGADHPALPSLSFTVGPGERVALIGASGGGKSTALRALLGLVPVTHGSITIGDVPLTEIDLDWWRSNVSWVPQSPRLFSGTVAANLRMARPDASDDEIRDALRRSQLPDFAAHLDRQLTEAGSNLSAGERRRLGLSRAFLRDTPIVLLDEPTSNLDPESERLVVTAATHLLVGRTSIVVSHRPDTIDGLTDRAVHVGTCPIEAMS